MKIGQRFNKPEYLFRPTQVIQRVRFPCRRYKAQEFARVRLPWDGKIQIPPADAIGRSLLTVGVHELAGSEVLWRLADEGDTCINIGANIGYMTSLLSTRVGVSEHVISFEPHPRVFQKLKRTCNP